MRAAGDRADTGQVQQGAAGVGHGLLEAGLEPAALAVDRGDPVQPSADQLDPHPALAVQQPAGRGDRRRSGQRRPLVPVAGHDDDQVGVDPVDQPDPFGDQLAAVVAKDRSSAAVSSLQRAAPGAPREP